METCDTILLCSLPQGSLGARVMHAPTAEVTFPLLTLIVLVVRRIDRLSRDEVNAELMDKAAHLRCSITRERTS